MGWRRKHTQYVCLCMESLNILGNYTGKPLWNIKMRPSLLCIKYYTLYALDYYFIYIHRCDVKMLSFKKNKK